MGCRACVLRDEITTAEKHTALKHTRQSGRETDVLNPNLMFDGKESKGGCCSAGPMLIDAPRSPWNRKVSTPTNCG